MRRSTCKKCKEKITEKTIRVGKKQKLPGDIISIAWNHLGCVVVPKSSTTEYFIENLEGFTDLNSEDQATVREHFTALAEKRSTPSKQASPTPKKKAKVGDSHEVLDLTVEEVSNEDEVFQMYNKMKLDELKDFMRWNNQMIGGTKPELVERCVDGHNFGALPECPEADCGGKLKYTADMKTVFCGGRYNEELASRVPCYYRVATDKVTNRKPWRFKPMTEDEKKEEEREKVGVDLSTSDDLFDGLDLSSMVGKRDAASRAIAQARELGINVPENEQDAKIRFGTLLMSKDNMTAKELLEAAAKQYGTKKKDAEKKATSGAGASCEANEGIVAAISQLSSAYLKTGNMNAGNTYKKAAAAVRNCTFPITSGKAISKGKGKIDGIGAKTGEYIDEFLETGKISKIQEKLSEAS